MRNKLYKILAAGFALAMAFTLSCSSDDDGGGNTMACKYIGDSRGEVCREYSGDIDSQSKQNFKERCENSYEGTYSDSCPDGYALKCVWRDTVGYSTYYYDNKLYGKKCEDL